MAVFNLMPVIGQPLDIDSSRFGRPAQLCLQACELMFEIDHRSCGLFEVRGPHSSPALELDDDIVRSAKQLILFCQARQSRFQRRQQLGGPAHVHQAVIDRLVLRVESIRANSDFFGQMFQRGAPVIYGSCGVANEIRVAEERLGDRGFVMVSFSLAAGDLTLRQKEGERVVRVDGVSVSRR